MVSEAISFHAQLLCFSDSHLWAVKWFSSNCLHSMGATRFLCATFISFFDVLVLCAHLPSPSGIWLLRLSAFLFVAASTLLVVRPTNVGQPFLHHPPYTTSFLVTFRCLSVHASLLFPSQHSLSRLQPRSFFQFFKLVLCRPSLPMDHLGPFQKHVPRLAGQTTLTSTATCPSNCKYNTS